MRKHIFNLMTFAILGLSAEIYAASFDCAKVQTNLEKMIYADAELFKLDQDLATTCSNPLKNKTRAPSIRTRPKKWMRERNTCLDVGCLVTSYSPKNASLRLHAKPDKSAARMVSGNSAYRASTLALFNYFRNETLPEQSDTPVCKDFKSYLNHPRSNELFKPDGMLLRESDLFKSVIWETLDKERYRENFTFNLEILYPKPYPEWGVVREWLRRYASPDWALQRTIAYPSEYSPKPDQRQRWIFRLVHLRPYTRIMADPKSKIELPTWFHFGEYAYLGYEDGSPLVGNRNYLLRKTPREWITYAGHTYAVVNSTYGSETGAVPSWLGLEIDELNVDPNGQTFMHYTCSFRAKNSQ